MRSISRFLSIAAIAFLAAGAAVVRHTERIVCAVASLATRAFRFAWDFIAPGALKGAAETKPRVVLVAARAFVLKQMQRTRPLFTARWRMCPSA